MRTATDRELIKLRLLQAAMLLSFAFIAFMLWRLQVERGHHYASEGTRQSVRRVRLPGTRGAIFDRNGTPLVENRPGYGLAIYLEELRQPGAWSNTIDKVEEVIGEVSAKIGMAPSIGREDIWNHVRKRLPLPLHGWREMDESALARWAEQTAGIPGIDIYPHPQRHYPQGDSAAHLLGYVGRAKQVQSEGERFDYYMPEYVGKSGIERSFDKYLRGEAGGYLVRVDVAGYRYEDEMLAEKMRPPHDGRDIQLALDLRVQRAAEEALGKRRGAMVVIDPRNGDVLAMANAALRSESICAEHTLRDMESPAQRREQSALQPRHNGRLCARQHIQARRRHGRAREQPHRPARPLQLPGIFPARQCPLPLLVPPRTRRPQYAGGDPA